MDGGMHPFGTEWKRGMRALVNNTNVNGCLVYSCVIRPEENEMKDSVLMCITE